MFVYSHDERRLLCRKLLDKSYSNIIISQALLTSIYLYSSNEGPYVV